MREQSEGRYVIGLEDIDRTQVAVGGAKGAHLGELSRIAGVHVPPGFCVTTEAFARILEDVPLIGDRFDRLSRLRADDRQSIREISAEMRRAIEGTAFPGDVAASITAALVRFGEQAAYAVRSSATAEDLPNASFAGQLDTYLNVVGPAAILQHVGRCWASLFSDRAVTYRLRNGFDHRKVRMAVVVQRMVFAQAAGILFTADPVTSNRKVVSIEAGFGLGEALVGGLVNADVYKVREGRITARTVAVKRRAIQALPQGGTHEEAVDPSQQVQPALTDAQVLQLAQLGRRIEAHLGRPQDIEWCLGDDGFQIVQSRPITTLYPVPESTDQESHVYVSVGHGQMMTDPMKPLGLSLFQLTALRPMFEAGGRLFVDVTRDLASPAGRARVLEAFGRGDPLIRDALETVLERDGFVPTLPDPATDEAPARPVAAPIETDPAIVAGLIARSEASLAKLKRDIAIKSGPALLEFILEDVQELKRILLSPQSGQVIMAALEASWWLNEKLEEWLGETNAVDTLSQSVSNNVTSEMGLALLDVADAIRPHPHVVEYLQHVHDDEGFLEELGHLPGGREARDAMRAYLEKYGMRCVGEIDITRPRWSERPTTLLPTILGNVRHFEAGAGRRRFEQGRQEAWHKEQDVLKRLSALPDGEGKAQATKRMIDRVRTFIGYREYPKYGIVNRYLVYKQALLGEAERLVDAKVLREKADVFYLTFEEFQDVVRTNQLDERLIGMRKSAFESYRTLTPPRVLTSDGEAVAGSYRRKAVPAGSLAGLAVSAGTVEGRARVVLDMAEARLEPGDILVTAFTDPSWTPLFVTIGGLVTEVGGLMTHGAVIAREYGVPAVVGVEHATRLIRDGQRIRLFGAEGYVELL